uniref:Transforming growth factor-beta-induced protein ig-h3 n=1 Tax=Cacopsylla melanoneura TaxID=428564 RepID=A0A8D8ZTE4_9HEMI
MTGSGWLVIFASVLSSIPAGVRCLGVVQLPNTTGISGELLANQSVDNFFSLWIVFNNDDIITSDKPYTILAPLNNASTQISKERLESHPQVVKRLLLDHVVLGQKLDFNLGANIKFTTLGGRTVNVRNKRTEGAHSLYANGAKVLNPGIDVSNGRLVILENYLFAEDLTDDHSFLQDMTEVLSFLQSGVRVFQHLLARSNVTRLLSQAESYTVFIPTDNAFQKWHPVDYGFYPFSVPEFTENVLTNHFIRGNVRQDLITDGQVLKTLGGLDLVFKKQPDGRLTVNNVELIKGDTPLTKGNIMFLPDVLFVTDTIVKKLREKNKDKETPPPISYPWKGSTFLSHSFLMLGGTPGYRHITRFLNMADLSDYVPGSDYTFFVPTDEAFEKAGLGDAPDSYLSKDTGLTVLLSHFVKGRLYTRDLKDNTTLETLSGYNVTVHNKQGNISIQDANLTDNSELFVYNLGTIFPIDNVLFKNILPDTQFEPTTTGEPDSTTNNSDVEMVPLDELNQIVSHSGEREELEETEEGKDVTTMDAEVFTTTDINQT